MSETVILDAIRTPFGRRKGALRNIRPDSLLASVLSELVTRTGVSPNRIDDVVAGCVSKPENRPPKWADWPACWPVSRPPFRA